MPMSHEQYSAWLSEWFHRRAPHVVFDSNENFFQAGAIDSLGVIELIEELERAFGVQFNQVDFQDRRFTNVHGLAQLLDEKSGS